MANDCTNYRVERKKSKNILYVFESDRDYDNVVAAFKRDFPDGGLFSCLNDVVLQLCKNGESVTLKSLLRDGGISGQILMPLHHILPYADIREWWFKSDEYIQETGHPIEIKGLSIRPSRDFGYDANLNFYDCAGDLSSFLVAIDGKLYREGIFVRRGEMGPLGAFLASTEMNICGVEMKSEKMPLESNVDNAGGFTGFSGGGVRLFGDIPTGQHELMFYAMDKRGNRSFAITTYSI